MIDNLLFFKNIEHCADSRTCQRISSVGRAVISRHQGMLRGFLIQHKRAYRDSAAKRLGTGHDIRLHAVLLPGEHTSGAAHSTLDLIQDQQDILLIAQRPDAFEKFRIRRINSALPLNRLQNDRTGLFRNLRFYALQVVEIRKPDSSDQRTERILIMGISCHRKRAHTPSMERVVHGNDLMVTVSVPQVGIFSRRFQRPFDGFRSAVCKEYLIHPAGFHHFFCCICHRLVVVQIGGVDQPVDLIFQGLIVRFISISQSKHCDSRREIQIFLSLHIIQPDSFSVVQNHRITVIGVQHIIFRFFHDLICFHDRISPRFHPGSRFRFPCW